MTEEHINVVNQLQDLFSFGVCPVIDLPQIVLVGTQSAGKSSVLEHIVGRSFLPRGTGRVTRCPLVLQLQHAPEGTEEYATFKHKGSEKFTDFNLIGKEIADQTEKLAGANNDICHTPITLKMFSPSFPNLTLVDLPGFSNIPEEGHPIDIVDQPRYLTLQYISNPYCIILFVTPAIDDEATMRDGFNIIRRAFLQGTRTLIVLTKLDLMKEGTDAQDMLLNGCKYFPAQLGIIGVVNSSVEDETVKKSLEYEAKFFQENYNNIAAIHGSPYLSRKLQELYNNKIKNCMPDLKVIISENLFDRKIELPDFVKREINNPTFVLLDLITKFSNIYISSVKGYSLPQTGEVCGLAKIYYVFQEIFAVDIMEIGKSSVNCEDVFPILKNARGMHSSIFVNDVAFEHLAKKLIEQFRIPSSMCVQSVHMELNNIARNCLEDKTLQLHQYPMLKSELGAVLTKLLQKRLPVTRQSVEDFIDIQAAYINTSHPDFLTTQTNTIKAVNENNHNVTNTDQTHQTIKLRLGDLQKMNNIHFDNGLVMKSLERYMSIVGKIVVDTIPKIIMHFMVNSSTDRLQVELLRQIYDKGDVEYLLQEPIETASIRKELEAEIIVLEEAVRIINTLKFVDQKHISS